MSDSSFVYKYAGGDCGTFNHTGTGTWIMAKNELKLRPNEDCYMLDSSYIMNKGILYSARTGVNGRVTEFKKTVRRQTSNNTNMEAENKSL